MQSKPKKDSMESSISILDEINKSREQADSDAIQRQLVKIDKINMWVSY